MSKKFTVYIKSLTKALIEILEHMVPGYLAYCEECGHIRILSYLKEAHRFVCYDCMVRYTKLYIKTSQTG